MTTHIYIIYHCSSTLTILHITGKKKSTQDKRDEMIKKDGDRQVRRIMKGGYD